jgi:hypothetical protein
VIVTRQGALAKQRGNGKGGPLRAHKNEDFGTIRYFAGTSAVASSQISNIGETLGAAPGFVARR